jgi:hypothetical protein
LRPDLSDRRRIRPSSRLLLAALRSQALEAGWDNISCYCPLSPFEKLEHLFIRPLGVGFMTQNDYMLPEIEPYKVIRSRGSPMRIC